MSETPLMTFDHFIDDEGNKRQLRFRVFGFYHEYYCKTVSTDPRDYRFMHEWIHHDCKNSLCPCTDQSLKPTLRAFRRPGAVKWIFNQLIDAGYISEPLAYNAFYVNVLE